MASIHCLFVTLVTAFITTVHCQDEPQITKEILPEIKRTGETGRLNCTITRQGNNKVYWIHQGLQRVITSDDKVDIEPMFNPLIEGNFKYDVEKTFIGDRVTYTLVIRRLEPMDSGRYACQIEIKGTKKNPTKEGQMVVLIPPAIIQSRTTHTLSTEEGANINLTCAANGYPKPKISWVRPNGQGMPKPHNSFTYQGELLPLTNVQRQDRGVYRCIADNTVQPFATLDATLYIDFKPFAKAVQSTYGQAQNRMFDLTIECRISGHPQPDLKWYQKRGEGLKQMTDDDKHNIHILLSHGMELSISEFWYQLNIISVTANDYGEYVCEGSNRLGISRASVRIYETSECQGPNCPNEGAVQAAGVYSAASSGLILFTTLLAAIWTH